MNRLTLTAVFPLLMISACARHDGSIAGLITESVTPRFETRIEIDTFSDQHVDYVVQDLDNDGQLDMAVIGLSGDLRVMLGSNGVFALGQRLPVGGTPIWMESGDIDGDGDQDLAIVRTGAGDITILLNDGNAQFSTGPVLQVGPDALSLLIADADDDGALDLIVSRPGSPEILVFLNDGTGAFTPGSSIALPNGGSPFTMTVAEVTRDTRLDLIISDTGNDRVLIFPGSPSATDFDPVPFELSVPGGPKATSVGDLNGDGVPDIAVSVFSDNSFEVITQIVLPVGGGATTYSSVSVPVSAPPSLSAIGDVTGDGLPDLVACVFSSAGVIIVPQLPGGTLGDPFVLDATGLPIRPILGDADNNGRADLFVLSSLNSRINLWLSRDTGGLVGSRSYATGLTTASYTQVADLDGDGRPEVIVGNNSDDRLSIMGANAAGELVVESSLDVGANIFNVRLADLDVDGRQDVLVPVDGGVKIYQNLSSPGNLNLVLRPATGAFGSGVGLFGVAAADFNRDGRNDLALVNFQSGDLQLLFGGSDPFEFGNPTVINIGQGPVDVVAGEFTGDGILDLAISRAGASDIVVYENDGAGNLALMISVPVGASPNYLLTEDFNRDGRTDLVVSNGTDGTVSVLFGSATGFARANYPSGNTPTALLVGDMTGEGAPDILVTSLVSGDFRVLVNDGKGGFSNILQFPGTVGASGAAMGDIDLDGDVDLIIASLTTSRLSFVRSLLVR